MPNFPIRLATRASRLALWQTEHVAQPAQPSRPTHRNRAHANHWR
ncbi:MAG: hypothetical protein WKG07_24690 [Hymenobacter sp.]